MVARRANDSSVLYDAACSYDVLLKKREVMELLRRAKATGYSNENWIHVDPRPEVPARRPGIYRPLPEHALWIVA